MWHDATEQVAVVTDAEGIGGLRQQGVGGDEVARAGGRRGTSVVFAAEPVSQQRGQSPAQRQPGQRGVVARADASGCRQQIQRFEHGVVSWAEPAEHRDG